MAGRGTDIKLDQESKDLGGLKIIGTERHESRRIDNQLRGRYGRQRDPGESRFYLSLEDDLLRLFGSERLMHMFEAMGVPEGEQIENKMLSNAIEKAQMKIEGNNFGIREQLLKFDEVNNEQREVIYKERRKVLDGDNMRDLVLKMITDIVYFVKFKQLLTDTVVIALDLHLSLLNSIGKHLMLDLLTFRYAHCLKHMHQTLRTEQS